MRIDLFVKKPIYAIVLNVAILLIGFVCFNQLPVRENPYIPPSVVTITTSYPGSAADAMEALVTTPLESALSTLDNLDTITSQSRFGQSSIKLTFKLGYSVNEAIPEISSRIQAKRPFLPDDIQSITLAKEDPNASPVVYINVSSHAMSPHEVLSYLASSLVPELENIQGVNGVRLFGGSAYSIRNQVDPLKLQAYDLSLPETVQTLQRKTRYTAAGSLLTPVQQYAVLLGNQPKKLPQFRQMIVKQHPLANASLHDISTLKLANEDRYVRADIDGRPSKTLGIIAASDANPLTVASRLRAQIARYADARPKDLKVMVFYDASRFIQHAIDDIYITFFEALACVLLVTLLCLGNYRLIWIPAISIPLSIIGSAFFMRYFGFSLNIFTMFAFILAIGMVVDDAIVILENIYRHTEEGLSPKEAACVGATEMLRPIIAMTITLAAVYAPIGLAQGITGLLFKEFAFTLASSIILSGVVALTLSPWMSARLIPEHPKPSRLADGVHHVFAKITNRYQRALRWACQHTVSVIMVFILLMGSLAFLYPRLPQELIPQEDAGVLFTFVSAPDNTSFKRLTEQGQKVLTQLKQLPAQLHTLSVYGFPTSHDALLISTLKDWDMRQPIQSLIQQILPKIFQIPGVDAYPLNPYSVPGVSGFSPISFVIQSPHTYQEMYPHLMAFLVYVYQHNPLILQARYDLRYDQQRFRLSLNEALMNQLGVKRDQIGQALGLGLSESWNVQFSHQQLLYQVISQLNDSSRQTLAQLRQIPIRRPNGVLMPLGDLIHFEREVVPNAYFHFQQFRAATLSASLPPFYHMGDALTWLREAAAKTLPADYRVDYADQSRSYLQSQAQSLPLFIYALLFIYLTLVLLYNSFIDPLVILLTVPACVFGACIALFLTHGSLNIYTNIAIITLVGLISKHGILLVDVANHVRDTKHCQRLEAAIEAAKTRFRPIIATTLTVVMSAVPLALASGPSAIARQQIGVCLIGGMLIGTLVSLWIIPVIYSRLPHTPVKKVHA